MCLVRKKAPCQDSISYTESCCKAKRLLLSALGSGDRADREYIRSVGDIDKRRREDAFRHSPASF